MSVKSGFSNKQLYQLVCYAGLEYARGDPSIRRIALYNPRYRAYWGDSVEQVLHAASSGRVDPKHFAGWIKCRLPKQIRRAWDECSGVPSSRFVTRPRA